MISASGSLSVPSHSLVYSCFWWCFCYMMTCVRHAHIHTWRVNTWSPCHVRVQLCPLLWTREASTASHVCLLVQSPSFVYVRVTCRLYTGPTCPRHVRSTHPETQNSALVVADSCDSCVHYSRHYVSLLLCSTYTYSSC